MTNLFVVATPIGNLEDITLRALRVLKEVDIILCEDTRVTKKLLQKYNINTPTLSYHVRSRLSKVEKIFTLLKERKNIALVSDAGTPTISDPGVQLVSEIREKLGDEVTIIAIPGPSAVVASLSISGLPASEFLFLGFLPHKKGRQTLFKEIADTKRTIVFYESPHRILKTLESLQKVLSSDRKVAIARELTKLHEQVVFGSITQIADYFALHRDKIKGEFVVVIEKS